MGGFAWVACLPYRLAMAVREAGMAMKFHNPGTNEFILCQNDISQQNIIVDKETHKINAIIDWEYAGFYPKEGAFYKLWAYRWRLKERMERQGSPMMCLF
jgi:aminoglycoside phosphotransferase (APT) family kinase protein